MLKANYFLVILSCISGMESLPHQDSSLGIVGGRDVNITEVPFMARYCTLRGFHCCGAAILSERYLISAAYCYKFLFDEYPHTIAIVGTDKTYDDGEAYVIEEAYAHPMFTIPFDSQAPTTTTTEIPYPPTPSEYGFNWKYNVVLLKLAKNLKFSNKVRPISLVDDKLKLHAGVMLDALGFGSTSGDPSESETKLPDQLQKVSVPFMSEEECRAHSPFLEDNMICVGSAFHGSGEHDEGGPLVYNGDLLGIHSFHPTIYSEKDFLNFFTSVTGVRDFINAYIQNDEKP